MNATRRSNASGRRLFQTYVRALLLSSIVSITPGSDATAETSGASNPTGKASLVVVPILRKQGPTLSNETVLKVIDRTLAQRKSIERRPVPDSDAFDQALVDCAQVASCIGRLLEANRRDFALVIYIDTTIQPPLLSLFLYDGAQSILRGKSIEDVRGGTSVLAALETRANALFDEAGYARRAQLMVHVRPDAEVRLSNGAVAWSQGEQPAEFQLDPGRYEIFAQAPGHESAQTETELTNGGSKRINLTLDPEEGSIFTSVWFWGVTGAVVASAIVTSVLLASSASNQVCVEANNASSCR
jgi:hypothetical protein